MWIVAEKFHHIFLVHTEFPLTARCIGIWDFLISSAAKTNGEQMNVIWPNIMYIQSAGLDRVCVKYPKIVVVIK